jgi:hypothetical protein
MDPADAGPGDPIDFRQLGQADAAGTITEQCLAIDLERSASDTAAFELSSTHAGAHSLNDQVAFEFADGADDNEHRLADEGW